MENQVESIILFYLIFASQPSSEAGLNKGIGAMAYDHQRKLHILIFDMQSWKEPYVRKWQWGIELVHMVHNSL